jgi:hypothetical protein
MRLPAILCWLRAEGDRIAGRALLLAAAVVVVVAYWRLSGSEDAAAAMAYLASGGIGALALTAAGTALVLSADLRDTWRKLHRLERGLRRAGAAPTGQRGQRPGRPALIAYAGWAAGSGTVIGLATVVAGWHRIARDGSDGAGIDGLAIAATGVVLWGMVSGSLLLAKWRDVERRLTRLFGPLLFSSPFRPTTAGGPAAGSVLIADGLRHYHASGCPAVAGIDAVPVRLDDLPPARTPCLLCIATGLPERRPAD